MASHINLYRIHLHYFELYRFSKGQGKIANHTDVSGCIFFTVYTGKNKEKPRKLR